MPYFTPSVPVPERPLIPVSLLTRLILSADTNQQLHNTFVFNGPIKLSEILTILQEITQETGGTVELRVMVDSSASLYYLDYWAEEEHPLNHRDKLLISFEDVIG